MQVQNNYNNNTKQGTIIMQTINNNTVVTGVAPTKSDKTFSKSDHFKVSDIELYFNRVIGVKQLAPNQTIRLTYDSYRWDSDSNSYIMGGVFTYKRPITGVHDLLKFMNAHTDNKNIPDEIKNKIGYSMSASVYSCDPAVEEAPGISSMLRTQTFVFDIDSRDGAERKSERYAFNNASELSKKAAASYLVGLINNMLYTYADVDWFLIPSFIYETGGGLQLIFKYTEDINEEEATLVMSNLKAILSQQLEEQKDKFKFYMEDIMGVRPVWFEIDFSTFDVTHTQRIGGTRNPKQLYAGAVAKELEKVYEDADALKQLLLDYEAMFKEKCEEVYQDYKSDFEAEKSLIVDAQVRNSTFADDKQAYITSRLDVIRGNITNSRIFRKKAATLYSELYYNLLQNDFYIPFRERWGELQADKLANRPVDQYTYEYYDLFLKHNIIPIRTMIVDCKILTDKFSSENSVNSKIKDTTNIGTYELLSKLSPYQQFQAFRSRLKGELIGTKYHKYLCPFHDEHNTPSLVLYHFGAITPSNSCPNNKNLYLYDFHDGQSYDLVSFVQALYKLEMGEEASKSDILNELALENNIILNKSDRKIINDADVAMKAEELVALVDTDNYIYYRRANKSKDCIIREYEDGTFVKFDGTRMMSDHVLESYLNVTNVNNEFKQTFHDAFCNKILKNRFEKFIPNRPHEFAEKKNSYVNLWVPGRAYKEVHELAESIEDMDNETSIEVVKATLPASWIFLNQLTQKGSLPYFVNWLACVAKYKVMPTLPILTSVQGTGKNVFVTEWLEYYLNQEYVNVATSEKIQSNFNAFMETSSMIVLDEGDFSRSKEVDQLKLLTGNSRITVEKKGFDSTQMQKYFNMIMLTNGECPIIHSYDDRRVSYFRLEVKLKNTVEAAGYKSIDTFIEALRNEVTELWAIMLKTKTKSQWTNHNHQDNVYNKQLLMMHPFGKLVMKIIEGDWDTIEFQLNENCTDKMIMANNMQMVQEIKNNYFSSGMISMDLINKYIASLSYKVHRNVIEFITTNQLHRFGINVIKHEEFMKVKVDKDLLISSTHVKNNLGDLFPEFNEDNINKTLNIKDVNKSNGEVYKTVGTENVQRNPIPAEGLFATGVDKTFDGVTIQSQGQPYVSSIVPPLMGSKTPSDLM